MALRLLIGLHMNYAQEYVKTVLQLHRHTKSKGYQIKQTLKAYRLFMKSAFAWKAGYLNVELSRKLAGRFHCLPKACFYNCMKIAKRLPEYRYFEGFATCIIPVEHAWLVAPDGSVVDPTWVKFVGTDNPPVDYYGVHVPIVEAIRNRENNMWEPTWYRFLMKGDYERN